MSEPSHPLVARARGLAPLVRGFAEQGDRERRPPAEVARALADAGLHRIAVPREYGGAEADPRAQIEAIEAVAEADGAAGWTLMIGIEVLGFCAAALRPETAEAVVSKHPSVVMAGALNPLGRARRVDGGFRVSGRWPFASGCQNADWFWGQCVIENHSGDPRDSLIEALFPKAEFRVVDTWNVTGLRGTGSHDVEVHDVFVPETHVTCLARDGLRARSDLFRLPSFVRLAYNKVGVATGIARAALAHWKEHAKRKTPRASRARLAELPHAQLALADAEASLRSARAFVFEAVDDVWCATRERRDVGAEARALVALACANAVRESARCVAALHEVSGTDVNFQGHPLDRCLRDVRVVAQHITVAPPLFGAAARVLLGLDSGSVLL